MCNLAILPASELDAIMAATEVSEVWGIGPRIAGQLRMLNVRTVRDAASLDPATVRRRWRLDWRKAIQTS